MKKEINTEIKPDRKTYSKPILTRTLSIHTIQAQRLLDRIFKRLVTPLYSMDVIVPITLNSAEAAELESKTLQLLETFKQALATEVISIKNKLSEKPLDEVIDYTHTQLFEAKISSPSIAKLADIISDFDLLMMLIDKIWLAKIITNQQRVLLMDRYEKQGITMMMQIEKMANQPPSKPKEKTTLSP